jgi:hypothetical protein
MYESAYQKTLSGGLVEDKSATVMDCKESKSSVSVFSPKAIGHKQRKTLVDGDICIRREWYAGP